MCTLCIEYELEILGICDFFDLALVKIKNYKNKFYCELSSTIDNIKLGTETYALGFPLGQENLKITKGVISGQQLNCFQTDTALNPGNSGGPLLFNDKVIGINSSGINEADGISYCVPITRFYLIKKQLFKKNILIHFPEFFGMDFQKTTKDISHYMNNKCEDGGVLIQKIHKNTPIKNTSMKKNDILCSINDIKIDEYGFFEKRWLDQKMTFENIISTITLHSNVKIEYWNKKKLKTNNFKLKEIKLPIRKIFPFFEKVDYEVIGGLVIMNLSLNHLHNHDLLNDKNMKYLKLSNRVDPKLIIANILIGSSVSTDEILKQGEIISKVNNIKVNTLKDFRNSFKKILKNKKGKFIKIETENNKTNIILTDTIKREENSLIKTYEYKKSKLFKYI